MASIEQGAVQNRLLRALRPEAFEMLQPTLERVGLPLRSFQVEANQKTGHVYFLESGLGSVVARTGVIPTSPFHRNGIFPAKSYSNRNRSVRSVRFRTMLVG
jgi:hypothetical protein